MNRGRHKKNNISKVDNIKKNLLLCYNAKNLDKWKNFTLEELKYLIKETFRQQEYYARMFDKPMRKVDLSIYERYWSTGMTEGGIDWELTKEGYGEWCYLMSKLCN